MKLKKVSLMLVLALVLSLLFGTFAFAEGEDGAVYINDGTTVTYYDDLQAAIDAAADGTAEAAQTVVVNKDLTYKIPDSKSASAVTYLFKIPAGKKVTLDLNGHTIYYKQNGARKCGLFYVESSAASPSTFTAKNGTVYGDIAIGSSANYLKAFLIDSYATLNIQCSAVGVGHVVSYLSSNPTNTHINIGDGTSTPIYFAAATSCFSLNTHTSSGDVTVYSPLKFLETYSGTPKVWAIGTASFKATSVGTAFKYEPSDASYESGISLCYTAGKTTAWDGKNYSTAFEVVRLTKNLKSGTYRLSASELKEYASEGYVVEAVSTPTGAVSGGTWYTVKLDSKYESYVARTKIATGAVTDGTWSYYATLQSAVDAAPANASTDVELLKDTEENITVDSDKTLTLDLNGHVINGGGNDSVITNNGELTIKDSDTSTSHYFKVGSDGLWTLDTTATSGTDWSTLSARPNTGDIIKVSGGVITGGIGGKGGGIYNNGTLTLSNVNIVGNKATASGGGIFNSCTLTVTGGAVMGNTSTNYAGGISNNGMSNSLYYNGTGTIENCVITCNSAKYGGGIHNGYKTILKGTTSVTRNTATAVGGGISGYGYWGYENKGQITVEGTGVTVKDNTCDADANASNLALELGYTLNVTGASGVSGGNIHIGLFNNPSNNHSDLFPTTAKAYAITGDNGAEDYSAYFTADNTAYSVYSNGTATAKAVYLGYIAASITKDGNTEYYGTVQSAIDAAASGDTVKVLKDVTEVLTVASDDTLTLDLNGHVIKGKGTGDAVITNNGILTVDDSGFETSVHNFKVDSNGLWTLTTDAKTVDYEDLTARPDAGAVVAVKGGCITGGLKTVTSGDANKVYGGGIYCGDSSASTLHTAVTLNSGNVIGNWARAGAGIYSLGYNKDITVNGGRVIGNYSSDSGAGIYQNYSVLTVTDGDISFNTNAQYGGGINCNWHSGTKLVVSGGRIAYNLAGKEGGGIASYREAFITGGTITGNVMTGGNGAGVYFASNLSSNILTLGGTVQITGNTLNGSANNVYVQNKPITVSTDTAPSTMKVGVTTATAPAVGSPVPVTNSNGANDYSAYFTSDNTAYSVYNDTADENAQVVYLGYIAASITKDGKTNYYGTVQAGINAAASGDTVKVLMDVTETVTVASDDTLTLDLNGHVINGGGTGSVITNNGTLEIKDSDTSTAHYFKVGSDGLWTLDTAASSGTDWSTLKARPSSGDIIKVTGGCITGGSAYVGGGVCCDSGNLTLTGGNIVGNQATGMGGGVCMVYHKGSFTMNGGRILGNVGGSTGGGGVGVDGSSGSFIMNDGLIGFNTSIEGGGVTTGCLFKMTGGRIMYNEATADYGYGGGVEEWGEKSGGCSIITGGTISGNIAAVAGAGVYVWNSGSWIGKLILGGNADISGNALSDGTTANNVYLATGRVITLGTKTSGSEGNGADVPAWTTPIGVTTETTPTAAAPVAVTGSNGTNDYSAYFTSDNTAYSVYNDTADENAQVVKLGVHEHVWTYAVKEGTTDTLTAACACTIGACDYAGSDTEITVIASDAEYDEAAHSATLSATSIVGITEMPAIQYEGVAPTAYTKSTDVPKDVGTYRASLTLKDSKGTETTAYADYSIAQTADTVKTAPTAISGLIYNGFPQTLITAGEANHGTMLYALGTDGTAAPETGWSADLPLGTKAGDYYVWYKSTGDGVNYGESVPACVTATIGKAPITVSNATFSYTIIDGKAEAEVISLVFDGLMADDTLVMNTDYEVTATLDNPTLSKATKVTVTVTLLDTAKANNYSISASQNFAIDEKPVMLATVTPAENTVKVGHKATFKCTLAKQKEEDATKQASYTYQWYVNRNDGYGYVKINGATGKSYTTAKTLLTNNGFTYQVAVTDNYNRTSWSNIATLYVVEHDVPGTGDASRPALWLSLSVVSLFGAALLLKKKKAF